MKNSILILSTLILIVTFVSCSKEGDDPNEGLAPVNNGVYNPTVVNLNQKMPEYLPRIEQPIDNPATEEGINLGKHLFYEPLLSADGSMSCGSCHKQNQSFSDGEVTSEGIDGIRGSRNAMHLVNLALHPFFFWDGRSRSLELQAIEPVLNPIEMHNTWRNALGKINTMQKYREMSYAAFGVAKMDSILAAKAIAQFVRSLISGNSKYDRWRKDPQNNRLTPLEMQGMDLFLKDRTEFMTANGPVVIPGADCFHCHAINNDFTDNFFHNNGLDAFPQDSGRAGVTNNLFDMGKFKTPSLRNVEYTAPYMHDGRFNSLDEVIDFYSEGLQHSPTIDPLMKNVNIGGVRLTTQEKQALKAFLLTLGDPDFLTDPDYSDPN